jgi:DNA-binding transcriptional regulator YdaS (Cro superfamily)
MTLAEYLTEQTATALAAKVGCEVSTITRIAKGDRSPSIDLAVRIERATDGAVTVADLAAVAVSPPTEEAGI